MLSRFKTLAHNLNEAVQYLEKEEKSFVLAGARFDESAAQKSINAENIVEINGSREADLEFIDGAGLTIGLL
jgi:hypothetical protein